MNTDLIKIFNLIKRILFKLFLIILLPSLVPILIFNFFKRIRFCKLGNISRIGHLTSNSERFYYFCKKNYKNNIIICVYGGFIANKFLFKKIKKKFLVLNFFYYIYLSIKLIPFLNFLIIDKDIVNHDYYLYLRKYKKKFFSLNKAENELGYKYLNSKGIFKKDKFVCVYCRDSEYLNIIHPRSILKKNKNNWSYHSYRDAKIETFEKTINYLLSKNYYVFRVGSHHKKKLNIKNKKFIDYSTNGDRSEFLDIFLVYKCQFLIMAGGGLGQVAEMFRKPILSTNIMPISMSKSLSNGLFMTKKLYNVKKKKFFSYKEIFSSEIKDYQTTQLYSKNKIKIIDNNEAEILNATKEFINVFGKNKLINKYEKNLLRKYYKINAGQLGYSQIAVSFLKKNKFFL